MPRNGQVIKRLVKIGATPDDCWEWLGRVSPETGYGKKQWYGKTILAHRWIYELICGPIPEDKVIDHICSNRKCVNPHHLRVVTQTENCRAGNGTKLTYEQAMEIAEAGNDRKWGDGARLARKYGVSAALVHDIWNGRAWRE